MILFFETAVRGQAESMLATHNAMRSAGPNPEAHIAFMEQRLAGMKAVQKARTDLYNVLTPEQKAIADRYWTGGPRI
ncbi:MAG TPA: Spy/CpxP family protein refolding chaperone [Sulfuricaulis sp.]|nr:Spy/CpxP family protein refolding chaperone [Sulfuricaulis sp.]